jgi:hypothetical protein
MLRRIALSATAVAVLAGALLTVPSGSAAAENSAVTANQALAAGTFTTPHYYPAVHGDTYFNTVGPAGGIVATADDSNGSDMACGTDGSDIVILRMYGPDPAHLHPTTVNCMASFGRRGGGWSPDGCSWKSGGITRVGHTLFLAVARQLRECSVGRQAHGLQPSFDASIMKSYDGGRTWINPWGQRGRGGAAPPWDRTQGRYAAMFPGRSFSAPFFIQYGPGNTATVDGAGRYLYAVSNDGYAYNGSYLHLGRVRLGREQDRSAWEFYHGRVDGAGKYWTHSVAGATRVLHATNGLSQPAIQYVPELRRYVLLSFYYSRAGSNFPTSAQTPYTRFRFYTAPKPWGPWTAVFDHSSQRQLWCTAGPCPLAAEPGSTTLSVGTPKDWLGLYDPALVQKFVFTQPMRAQTLFTSGDFKNPRRYPGERLYRLHAIPFDLRTLVGG